MRVGLETLDGQEISRYELSRCTSLTGDAIRKTVSWEGESDISPLKGQTVRLRFQLQDADLYSVQFQPWLR